MFIAVFSISSVRTYNDSLCLSFKFLCPHFVDCVHGFLHSTVFVMCKYVPLFVLLLTRTPVKVPPKPMKTFKLPEFPPPLAYQYVQSYYSELIGQLGKAINSPNPEDSSLMARYYYLRGLINSVAGKRLDALMDFQSLHRTDVNIFPLELVNTLVDSLGKEERNVAEGRPELKRLLSKVKKTCSQGDYPDGGSVKKFELPRTHMFLEDFVRRVQESGIVNDLNTIQRLFQALTVGE